MTNATARFPTSKRMNVDELIKLYDGIIEDADRVLLESNIAGRLPLPGMPSGLEDVVRWSAHNDPLPPDDLTDTTDLVIGKLFSFFQNWTNYVSAETTRAKAIRDVQDRHLKVVRSAISIYYREEEKKAASMVDDYVNTDSRFVEVDAALLRIKVFYETARDRYDQLKRVINNVSREQTRRREEMERLNQDEFGRGGPRESGSRAPRFVR